MHVHCCVFFICLDYLLLYLLELILSCGLILKGVYVFLCLCLCACVFLCPCFFCVLVCVCACVAMSVFSCVSCLCV